MPKNDEISLNKQLKMNQRNSGPIRRLYHWSVDTFFKEQAYLSCERYIYFFYTLCLNFLLLPSDQDPSVERDETSKPTWFNVSNDFFDTAGYDDIRKLFRDEIFCEVPGLEDSSVTCLCSNLVGWMVGESWFGFKWIDRRSVIGCEDDTIIMVDCPFQPEYITRATSRLIIINRSCTSNTRYLAAAHAEGLISKIDLTNGQRTSES